MMKRIAILGSTGSIGTQTLDVIANHPDRFEVVGLAAGWNTGLILEQIRRFRPRIVSVADEAAARELKDQAGAEVQIVHGDEGLIQVAAHSGADMLVTAIVGSRGLAPTLAAIEAGVAIGLANKETLVSAGHLIMDAARRCGVPIIPIDSEHSAIFQCLNGEDRGQVSRIILTASGGSFRDKQRSELANVTVEEALRHPNWSMGAKITIDSATMVNKGLEVIEAHWLFGLDYDRIDVVIHPESIIHSMVEYADTSIIAQLGNPDMRVPIQYALTYPDRIPGPSRPLDLVRAGALHFRPMDTERYPSVRMAYEAGRCGGTMPTVFNAANEVAVERFLRGDIRFLQIEEIIASVMEQHQVTGHPGLEEILAADSWAKERASRMFRA
jgi:1-deoxy-D-xylulose-5-phosphate reductoisomerase